MTDERAKGMNPLVLSGMIAGGIWLGIKALPQVKNMVVDLQQGATTMDEAVLSASD
eukprot:COSAG05_NODE_5830_length_1078_cov_1.426966_1_plen_55_part_01